MNIVHNKGFTLIELIVSTGIFVMLLSVMIGIYSRFTSDQRRAIAEHKLLENAKFALDFFNREARTAYSSTFELTDGTGQSILFRNQGGLCVNYRLTGSVLERAELEQPIGDCSISDFTINAYASVTSSGMRVASLRFDPIRSTASGATLDRQGFVTIMLEAESQDRSVAPVVVQSTVTSRQVQPYQNL